MLINALILLIMGGKRCVILGVRRFFSQLRVKFSLMAWWSGRRPTTISAQTY